MNQNKLLELKERAKSALGISQLQLSRKSKMNISSSVADDSIKIINSIKGKEKFYKPKSSIKNPQLGILKKMKEKERLELGYSTKKNDNNNYNIQNYNNQYSDKGTFSGYEKDEYQPFILSTNSKNIVNINNKLISDLNEQINILNERKRAKKFSYKQTVNLQKLNDYIIYEYTKNKMEFNKMNHKKNTTSFRLPIQYRRMGNNGKKEDLIPISILPKINLEDILILHNSNARNTVSKNKVHNYYLKNNIKYKKSQINPHNNKEYSDEIALKYINIY
jgi:hypothetical protein